MLQESRWICDLPYHMTAFDRLFTHLQDLHHDATVCGLCLGYIAGLRVYNKIGVIDQMADGTLEVHY